MTLSKEQGRMLESWASGWRRETRQWSRTSKRSAPLIRGAYERFGEEVILQIMFGMIAPDVFEALWKRRVARTSAGPRGPKALWQ